MLALSPDPSQFFNGKIGEPRDKVTACMPKTRFTMQTLLLHVTMSSEASTCMGSTVLTKCRVLFLLAYQSSSPGYSREGNLCDDNIEVSL